MTCRLSREDVVVHFTWLACHYLCSLSFSCKIVLWYQFELKSKWWMTVSSFPFTVKNECQIIRTCVSGHIYDSSPVELISDLGARFAVHPTILKIPGSSQLISWLAKGVSSGLDALYLTRFDSQRDEYWRTLCSSVVSSPVSFYLP